MKEEKEEKKTPFFFFVSFSVEPKYLLQHNKESSFSQSSRWWEAPEKEKHPTPTSSYAHQPIYLNLHPQDNLGNYLGVIKNVNKLQIDWTMTLKAPVKWLIQSNRCTVLHSAQRFSTVGTSAGLARDSRAWHPFYLALFDWQEPGNSYWEEEDGWWAELCSPCPPQLVSQCWAADVATSGQGAATALQRGNCWLWAESLWKLYSVHSPISSFFPVDGARELLPSRLADGLLKTVQFCWLQHEAGKVEEHGAYIHFLSLKVHFFMSLLVQILFYFLDDFPKLSQQRKGLKGI